MNGEFVWYDLQTSDPEAARTFYTGLLGWTTQVHGPSGASQYTMWKAGDQAFGGVMVLSEEAKKMGARPEWIGYVQVPSASEAAARCTSLGGRVYVPATDIAGSGRFAILGDPQGATIAAYEASSAAPQGEAKLPVSWCELATADPDAGFTFYEQMFGWRKTESMAMPGGGLYQMFGAGGNSIGGIMKKSDQMPMSAWMFYFSCRDTRKVHEQATKQGVRTLYAPMQVPGGDWAALIADPQGAVVGLFSKN